MTVSWLCRGWYVAGTWLSPIPAQILEARLKHGEAVAPRRHLVPHRVEWIGVAREIDIIADGSTVLPRRGNVAIGDDACTAGGPLRVTDVASGER